MGRLPHSNNNLPPHMRKRVRKYGTYYFYDTGEKPRREIPLGKDYITALQKYAELEQNGDIKAPLFGDAITRYLAEEIPKKAKNTIRVQLSDIKHLKEYFSDAPMDQVRPMHIRKFLDKHKKTPTTANRCKRLFSAIWNAAKGWGYTDLVSPTVGIIGFGLSKRDVYITDDVFNAVRSHASEQVKDAIDLAYLTGQRPADALRMTDENIKDGFLVIAQGKTKKKLRITITGELATLLGKIAVRKAQYKIEHCNLLMNRDGKPLTKAVLRNHFKKAKQVAIEKMPEMEQAIKEFWFYDLRAKAADDVGDERGDKAASNLLGHDNEKTTNKHYRRRGKIVEPTR
ncbi:MAG: tyrosine-type recombinase/integrase [Burkholderiaceae bacterium]